MPAPTAAATASSTRYTSLAFARNALSLTARRSTWVTSDGMPMTTLGRTRTLLFACLMKYDNICSAASKSAMTPSRIGLTASIPPGTRPSIRFASLPTASMLPVSRLTATIDGSLTTIPLPLAYTQVFAVPRSIARSLDEERQRGEQDPPFNAPSRRAGGGHATRGVPDPGRRAGASPDTGHRQPSARRNAQGGKIPARTVAVPIETADPRRERARAAGTAWLPMSPVQAVPLPPPRLAASGCRQQDGELVAPDAGHQIGLPGAAPEAAQPSRPAPDHRRGWPYRSFTDLKWSRSIKQTAIPGLLVAAVQLRQVRNRQPLAENDGRFGKPVTIIRPRERLGPFEAPGRVERDRPQGDQLSPRDRRGSGVEDCADRSHRDDCLRPVQVSRTTRTDCAGGTARRTV